MYVIDSATVRVALPRSSTSSTGAARSGESESPSLTADVTCSDSELHVADYHGDTDGVRAARVISMRARQVARVGASTVTLRRMRRRPRLRAIR